MLTTEEFEALRSLAKNAKVALPAEFAERLLNKGYIERGIGVWMVTSRGHALLLRAPDEEEPPPDAA